MLSFLFLLSLFGPGAFGADRGPQLVKGKMAHFYNAWVVVAGEEATQKFFTDWEVVDVAFLNEKLRKLHQLTAPELEVVPAADHLYDHYGGVVFGASGEVYGNVAMRARADPLFQAAYMDENEYVKFNPRGNKPDGICFRIIGKDLVILSIMESKLGHQGWAKAQIDGFLKRWTRHGLTVQAAKGPAVFGPQHIFLQLSDVRKPIGEVDYQDIRKTAVLIGTSDNRSFTGTYLRLPVDATKIREVVEHYIKNIRGTRAAPRGASQAPAPVLEGEELQAYRDALRDFILERKQWPKSSLGQLGAELRKHMSRRGGQARAFLNDLDGPTRFFIARYGDMPPMTTLAQHLRLASPADPNVISALRAYLIRYEARPLGEASPFLNQLAAYSAEWKLFLAQHSADELRQEDLSEAQSCAEYLAKFKSE